MLNKKKPANLIPRTILLRKRLWTEKKGTEELSGWSQEEESLRAGGWKQDQVDFDFSLGPLVVLNLNFESCVFRSTRSDCHLHFWGRKKTEQSWNLDQVSPRVTFPPPLKYCWARPKYGPRPPPLENRKKEEEPLRACLLSPGTPHQKWPAQHFPTQVE